MRFESRKPGLAGRLELIAGLSIIGFLLGLLGRSWWVFDLFSHFRLQYAGTLVLCLLVFVALRRWKSALICAVAVAVLLATLRPFFRPADHSPAATERLKIVSFNVNTANTHHAELLDFLEREDADVVFLMEVDKVWMDALRKLDQRYPFSLKSPRDDNFGTATFSKLPFEAVNIQPYGLYDFPVLDASVKVGQRTCRILGLHPLPPTSADSSQQRNEQLFEFAHRAAESSTNGTILLGDFNLTPFSPWFDEILKRSGLQNSAIGFGCGPTWQRNIPCFAIPIDQALVSQSLVVLDRKIGPSLSSDHNALILTVAFREGSR